MHDLNCVCKELDSVLPHRDEVLSPRSDSFFVFDTAVSSNSSTGKDEDTELCEDVIEGIFRQALGGSVSAPEWLAGDGARQRKDGEADRPITYHEPASLEGWTFEICFGNSL